MLQERNNVPLLCNALSLVIGTSVRSNAAARLASSRWSGVPVVHDEKKVSRKIHTQRGVRMKMLTTRCSA